MATWTEQYQCHTAQIGRIGKLSVNWQNDGGYRVSAFGVTLKTPSSDLDDGKRRAVAFASELMAKANLDL